MPRAKKAPQREGAPGYTNRTDLMDGSPNGGGPGGGPPTQPIRTPTGQAYGKAKALEDAQRAAPLPQAPRPGAERLPGTMTPKAAVDYTPPNLGLNALTTRPDEPITAGVPVGSGPGPQPQFNVAAMYRMLAASTNDPRLASLADLAEIQGF